MLGDLAEQAMGCLNKLAGSSGEKNSNWLHGSTTITDHADSMGSQVSPFSNATPNGPISMNKQEIDSAFRELLVGKKPHRVYMPFYLTLIAEGAQP